MADPLFDLYFSGKTTGAEEAEQVRLKVGKIFGADYETLDRLFSGRPVRIKSGVDQETAIRYRVALRDAGALLDIKPHTAPSQTVNAATTAVSGEELTLLPPNTGNLIDCATPVTPTPLPDITGIALAPAGAVIDESDRPPPKHIDTAGLTLALPRTGSLEDCQPVVTAKPIPDISHIELVQGETANPNTNPSDS
ncbi:MAG: hypothetical protein KDI18_03945 [Gammaproteobacteria bacterium]|nr:hypothetical protein [Gammaproteobacteria bacterium]